MPSGLPLLINSITLASVTFFLLFRLAFLNTPLRPGPTFVSALSVLWQTLQFEEKVSLPLAASPGFASPKAAVSNKAAQVNSSPAYSETLRLHFIVVSPPCSLRSRGQPLPPSRLRLSFAL